MKQIKLYLIITLVSFSFSCKDKVYETFTANAPIYLSYEKLRESVKKVQSRSLEKPGKIYFKDDYIFINENMEGVHIIDVSNTSDPQNIGFIEIPGNVDIAIKENTLYADNFVDLVAIDISDLSNISEIGRVKDVFPYTIPEYDNEYPLAQIDKEQGVVLDWEVRKITQEVETHYYPNYRYEKADSFAALSNGGATTSGTTFGVGGSMARFGLYKDVLYTVGRNTLNKFNISDIDNPKDLGSNHISWNIETMFIYDDHMFLGTTTAMLVYSLEVANNPTYVNRYNHFKSCDPVVIQNDLAYVTLRGGTRCGSNSNLLEVIRLKDNYTNLELVSSYPMHGPYGLGIDDEVLFVCDGEAGLKVYNVSDPEKIDQNSLATFQNIKTYDVIPVNGYLFMIGENGFYLYDYNDIQDIKMIASIPIS